MAEMYVNTMMQEALKAMGEKRTPIAVENMILALTSSKFYCPASWDKDPKIGPKGEKIFEPDTKFNLLMLEGPDKKRYIPLFTSMDEAKKWEDIKDLECLLLTYEQFEPWVEASKNEVQGIVIDPFGFSIPLDAEFVSALKKETSKSVLREQTIQKGETIAVRDPIRKIDDFKEALCDIASQYQEIKRVWLKERLVKGKPSHWFIIVEMQPENPKLFQTIGHTCRKLAHDKEMEFVFASIPSAKSMIENTTPIYNVESCE